MGRCASADKETSGVVLESIYFPLSNSLNAASRVSSERVSTQNRIGFFAFLGFCAFGRTCNSDQEEKIIW